MPAGPRTVGRPYTRHLTRKLEAREEKGCDPRSCPPRRRKATPPARGAWARAAPPRSPDMVDPPAPRTWHRAAPSPPPQLRSPRASVVAARAGAPAPGARTRAPKPAAVGVPSALPGGDHGRRRVRPRCARGAPAVRANARRRVHAGSPPSSRPASGSPRAGERDPPRRRSHPRRFSTRRATRRRCVQARLRSLPALRAALADSRCSHVWLLFFTKKIWQFITPPVNHPPVPCT